MSHSPLINPPSKLVLYKFIFRDHSVLQFHSRPSQEGVIIDRIYRIDPTKTYLKFI